MKKILVISAHPDDETLGCGGAIARWVFENREVNIAILADGIGARTSDGALDQDALRVRQRAAEKAWSILGVQERSVFVDLPDNQPDIVSILAITKQIEAFLEKHRPDTLVTHHAGDVNIDHQRVRQVVITACRPQFGLFVRRSFFFEAASNTERKPPGGAPPCAPDFAEEKLAALQAYQQEFHRWPQPPSIGPVTHQARWRGATAGMETAEAFILGREHI